MKVLVPVEDPLFGAAIVDFIARHKWPERTEFLVVHVIDPRLLDHSTEVSFVSLLKSCDDQVELEANRLVNAASQAIRDACPHATVALDVMYAPVREQLIRIAKGWEPDLVIAGSHGGSGFQNFLLGSVSFVLISELQMPVVLVKPDKQAVTVWADLEPDQIMSVSVDEELRRLKTISRPERILVAVDESMLSQQMIDFVCKHQWPAETEFRLVSAVHSRVFPMLSMQKNQKLIEQMTWDREGVLNVLADKLRRSAGISRTSTVVERGKAREVVLKAAQEWNASLLLVGCHFRHSLQRFFLGSTALPLLCAAPCTVILFKERQHALQAREDVGEALAKVQ